MSVHIDLVELRGVERILASQDQAAVRLHRNPTDPEAILEVGLVLDVAGERLLFVLRDEGVVARINPDPGDDLGPLMAVPHEELPLLRVPKDTDAAANQNDLAVELSNLAEAQIDGLGAETGQLGRARMRAILDELDARDE